MYAREIGSAAAPTAGLHFTPELLERIKAKGIDIVPVLLHVGLGTFRPVKAENVEDHVMHARVLPGHPPGRPADQRSPAAGRPGHRHRHHQRAHPGIRRYA